MSTLLVGRRRKRRRRRQSLYMKSRSRLSSILLPLICLWTFRWSPSTTVLVRHFVVGFSMAPPPLSSSSRIRVEPSSLLPLHFSQRTRRARRGTSAFDDDDEDEDDDDYYHYYNDDMDMDNDNDDRYYDERDQINEIVQDMEYEDEDDEYDDGYWDKDDEREEQQTTNNDNNNNNNRGGMYKVHFDWDIDPKRELQVDWERCSDGKHEALVLLPPRAVERPTAVLHFVGGTFFGSLPKLWYRSLLEGLVRNTSCAIIVTPIPVTLLKSPLQHISLSKKIQAAFDNAWTTVLEDEYGDVSDIPLCGMGHSLGARLLVVLATLTQNKPRQDDIIPTYKSFVLISFTNYGASAGIPGVSTLLKQSKRQEVAKQLERDRNRRKKARKLRQEWWVDDEDNDDWDDPLNKYRSEEDEEWDELVDDLQQLVQEQASRVKTALTPQSKDLEFYPSPDKLWKALENDQRYHIPQTLAVQFDDDPIDQSSKLASILHTTNATDIHFARLRGAHLTPISVDEGNNNNNSNSNSNSNNWWGGLLSSQTSRAVWKAIKGRGKTRAQEEAMRDLRQSLCRYISDVVTKD